MLAIIKKKLGPRYAVYVAGGLRKSEFSALAPFSLPPYQHLINLVYCTTNGRNLCGDSSSYPRQVGDMTSGHLRCFKG